MGKRRTRRSGSAKKPSARSGWLIAAAGLGVLLMVLVVLARKGGLLTGRTKSQAVSYAPRPRGEITFAKHIAPILFEHCASCHRPNQSAPFPLLTYADAKKRAADIAAATERRQMPPWLPEHGYGEFVGERRLNADQIGLIGQWVAEGAVEGAASDLPPTPQWRGDWQLGEPDLVITMPEPYLLPAEGRDVYRNFALPVPVRASRYVRAVELRPGNSRVVHHAFVKLDRTPQSRRQDERDAGPGFSGMNVSAEMPDGHFLGWQPGRLPQAIPEGLAWRIDPGNDLVLQMHLNPSGKPEPLQSSVGLYFTERPPTNTCFKLGLVSFTIEIRPGEREHVVEDSFVMPVDAQALAVFPHAHHLAKEMQGWATLPDGTRRWLLWIKEWDFNWQGDYRYAQPVFLPKDSTLSMRFTYDNSTNNIRNPNHPPRPVSYGPQSSDEMAELAFELLPRNKADYDLLAQVNAARMTRAFMANNEHKLRKNPDDAEAHAELGMLLIGQNQLASAEQHLFVAARLKPDRAANHYGLGVLFRSQNKLAEARREFETTLRLDSNNAQAHGNLGFICLEEGDLNSARMHFETALRQNPEDAIARNGLERVGKAAGLR